jgi:hypothetical protein
MIAAGLLLLNGTGCWIGAMVGTSESNASFFEERDLDQATITGLTIETAPGPLGALGIAAEGQALTYLKEDGSGDSEVEQYEFNAGAKLVPHPITGLSDSIFKPYIAAGASWAFIEGETTDSSGTTTEEFEGQGMQYYARAGIDLEFWETVRAGASFRYLISPDIELDSDNPEIAAEEIKKEDWQFFVHVMLSL